MNPQPRTRLVIGTTKKDSIVPLKPEHEQSQSLPARTVLGQVDENGSSALGGGGVKEIKLGPGAGVGGGVGGTTTGGTKLDALKAKLAAQKKRSRAGTGALSSTIIN